MQVAGGLQQAPAAEPAVVEPVKPFRFTVCYLHTTPPLIRPYFIDRRSLPEPRLTCRRGSASRAVGSPAPFAAVRTRACLPDARTRFPPSMAHSPAQLPAQLSTAASTSSWRKREGNPPVTLGKCGHGGHQPVEIIFLFLAYFTPGPCELRRLAAATAGGNPRHRIKGSRDDRCRVQDACAPGATIPPSPTLQRRDLSRRQGSRDSLLSFAR